MDSYVLLDIRGLALRSLHSGTDRDGDRDSITGKTVNTAGHAIDNLVNSVLLPILKDFRVKQVVAVWDGGNLYRETRFPDYKKARKEREQSPELKFAISETIKHTKLLLKYLGITQVVVDTVEADDVIAWMAKHLPASMIYTVDRDLAQLGSDSVVLNIGHEFIDCFKDKDIEVPFNRVALYKSLVGDSSDGYKGVNGFGPAKWLKLVETYGDDGLQQLQDMLTGAGYNLLKKLAESGSDPLLEMIFRDLQNWIMCWDLAILHPSLVNSKTEISGKSIYLTPKWSTALPRADKLGTLLDAVGCQDLRQTLAPFMPNPPFILDASALDDEEGTLAQARELFAESPFISIDWETSAPVTDAFIEAANGREYVDMLSSTITGAGFTFGKNLEHTFYATVDHAGNNNLPAEFIPKLIDCIPAGTPLVIQNLYFEQTIYKNQFGRDLPPAHDTKVMSSHVDEQESSGLKDMSLRILGYKQLHYHDVIEKGTAMRDYSAEHVLQYGADDPLVTAHLYEFLKLQLLLEGTWDFVRQNEFPPIYLLSDAYLAGIDIDWQELDRLRIEDQEVFDTNMARLRELLRENQTDEVLQEGIRNLLEVEREMIDAKYAAAVKAKQLEENDAKSRMAEDIAALTLKIEERVTYRDMERVEKPIDFKMTAVQFSEVFEYLGLPALEKTTNKAWVAWKEATLGLDHPDSRAERILGLIRDLVDCLHQKNCTEKPKVQRLMELCREVKVEATPDDKRYETVGSELSLSSPLQMKALLYGMLALPLRIRSFDVTEERADLGLEGGAQANEDAILTAMATDAPEGSWKREALECLLKAKKAQTRNSNFYSKYPLWQHPKTGLVHPQLNSCGTETRRMSGSSPNLMQMPKRGDGIKFRNAVIPLKGHDLICSIDWAGEELRVGAGLSRDIEMLSCYIDGNVLKTLPDWMIEQLGPKFVERFRTSELRDIHSLTAAGIAGVPYEQFEEARHDDTHPDAKSYKKIRGDAKGVNFLSQYGGGPTKLARKLICDPEIAKDYLSAKKKLYSGYEDWREKSIEQLHSQGYLTTLYGSRRHLFSKLLTNDEGMRGYLERSALNSLIQGVCADYLKVVLTALYQRKTFQRHGAQFLAPIHDELVFSCHSSKAPSLIMEVHSIMTQGIPGLPCPLWAEPSLGPNFGTQVEIGPHPTPELINYAIDKALGHAEAA
jgi:DNA polymerase I-like protein with 3'-5' exonuclease and polymerase domains/5'-3' exonuclease